MNRMKLNSETITLLAIKDISNELNEKESESWNKLTRVLTHEIMNTIAPIVSLSQTLSLRPGTDEKVIRGLGVIREQSEKTDGIHRIISTLIVYAGTEKEAILTDQFIAQSRSVTTI